MAQVPSDLKSKHPFLPLPIQAKAVMEPQLGLIPLLLLLCADFVLCSLQSNVLYGRWMY